MIRPNMFRSIFSNWVGMVVAGATSIILTPILIHQLGDYYYGLWILLASVTDYYGLLDLGMRWTLFRFVAQYQGAGDRKATTETLASALAVTVGIGLFLLAVTAALIPVLPSWLGVTGTAREIARPLLLILGMRVAIAFPFQLLCAYLRGIQRFDYYNFSLTVISITRVALVVAVLRLGYGIVALAAMSLILDVAGLALQWYLVRRADPGLALNWSAVQWTRIKALGNFSVFAFVSNAGEALRFSADSLVIARVLGVALVTPFNVAGRLMEYFRSVMTGINGPLMARMGELDGKTDIPALRLLFLRATKVTALITFFVATLLILNGRELLRLWVGNEFVSSYVLVVILCVGYAIAFAQEPCRLLVFAQGRYHRILSAWTIAEGVANLALSVYWGRKYGLVGIAMGTAVPLAAVKLFVQPIYALRPLELKPLVFIRGALAGPLLTTLAFAAIAYPLGIMGTPGRLHLLRTTIWEAVLFAFLSCFISFSIRERRLVVKSARALIERYRMSANRRAPITPKPEQEFS